MSRWPAAALIAVALLTSAGCDTSSEPPPEGVTTTRPPPPPAPTPAEVHEVESCDDLVEVGVLFVRNMVHVLEAGVPIGVLTGEEEAPPEVDALEEVGRELDARVARLGCVVGDLNAEIVAEVEDIESDEPVVALFLDIVRSGVIDPLPPSTGG